MKKNPKPKNMFNKMHMMRKVLKIDLDGKKKGLRSCNKDKVIVITGPEGMGKSNIAQCMFDIWYQEVLKDENYNSEYIRFFGSNKEEFLEGLKHCAENNLKYMMVAHDEAAKDLYSRKAMTSFSADLNIAYQVIRGLNLYTILIIPNVMDLDSFFRKRRLSGMIHVFNVDYENQQTQFAYYNKERLDDLIPEMKRMAERENNPDPFKCSVAPLFYDTAPLYSGELKDAYNQRKTDNMKDTITELYGKHVKKDENDPEAKKLDRRFNFNDVHLPMYKRNADQYVKMYSNGKSYSDIADQFFTTKQTIMHGVKWYLANIASEDEREKLSKSRKKLKDKRKK